MDKWKFEINEKLGYDYHDGEKFKPNGMPVEHNCTHDIEKYRNTYNMEPVVHCMWDMFDPYKKLVANIRGDFVYLVEQFGAIDKLTGQEEAYKDYSFLKHIKPSTMKRIRKGQGRVVVLAPDESRVELRNLVHFHEQLKKFKIDMCHYVTGNNWTVAKEYEKWYTENEEPVRINIINSYQQMHLKGWDLHRYHPNAGPNSFVEEDDIIKTRKKRFVCFNRRLKPHRYALVAMLHHLDLLKDNLVSFSLELGKDLNHFGETSPPQKNKLTKILGKTELRDSIRGYYDELVSMSPQTVDYPEVSKVIGPGCELKDPYLDSYFTIVTETMFDYDGCWFSTEKIYRPMLHYHPFIVYGSPYTLRELRKKGFKTFHPYIDESYDEVDNHYGRFKKIIKEIKRLCSMSEQEIYEWYVGMKDIVIHNRNLMYDYGEIYYKNMPKIIESTK